VGKNELKVLENDEKISLEVKLASKMVEPYRMSAQCHLPIIIDLRQFADNSEVLFHNIPVF
jgi:hypothetical protein